MVHTIMLLCKPTWAAKKRIMIPKREKDDYTRVRNSFSIHCLSSIILGDFLFIVCHRRLCAIVVMMLHMCVSLCVCIRILFGKSSIWKMCSHTAGEKSVFYYKTNGKIRRIVDIPYEYSMYYYLIDEKCVKLSEWFTKQCEKPSHYVTLCVL